MYLMSFFHKQKMSQNVWATIMPFGPVTLIFYRPKNLFSDIGIKTEVLDHIPISPNYYRSVA